MATVSTQQTLGESGTQRPRIPAPSRRIMAPPGVVCPHCLQGNQVYFSSAQRRKPLHKQALFAYLRCHACTHRFRTVRFGPALFMAAALAALLLMGMVV